MASDQEQLENGRGLCSTRVMQDKELAKGSRLCNCNQRQLQENWKTVLKASKIFGTFMDRLDSLKVNMIMEGGVIRIDVRSQVEESYQDLGWGVALFDTF